MRDRLIIIVLACAIVGCQSQHAGVPPFAPASSTTVKSLKPSGKVFSESELVAMGFKESDLRPHYLEPVYVKKGVPLGDVASQLNFSIESIRDTIQASGPADAHHVIIPTGICYIEYLDEVNRGNDGRSPKALVNVVVLQVPLRPFTDSKKTTNQVPEDTARKLADPQH